MSQNGMADLMKYFNVPIAEFREFWKNLTDEEKDEFKNADLSS